MNLVRLLCSARSLYLLFLMAFVSSCCDGGILLDALIELSGCDNRVVEEIDLPTEALTFVPHQETDSIVFRNVTGNRLAFYFSRKTTDRESQAKTEPCHYYSSELRRTSFHAETTIDSLKLRYRLTFKTRLSLVPSKLPSAETHLRLVENHTWVGEDLVVPHQGSPTMQEITLLRKTFQNVFFDTYKSRNIIYFNQSQGVVGFTDLNNEPWVRAD